MRLFRALPLKQHKTMKNGVRNKEWGARRAKTAVLISNVCRVAEPRKETRKLQTYRKRHSGTGNFCQDLNESQVMEICDQLFDG
jgi:hypothetical protein